MILFGILAFIVFGIFIMNLILIFKYNTIDQKQSKNNDQFKVKIEQLSKLNDTCPGPIELPCKEGPPGEQGVPGGIYTDKGPLRNLAQVDMVADRMDGYGLDARPYLSTRSYQPQQTWILNSSNKNDIGGILENQYGGCLAM